MTMNLELRGKRKKEEGIRTFEYSVPIRQSLPGFIFFYHLWLLPLNTERLLPFWRTIFTAFLNWSLYPIPVPFSFSKAKNQNTAVFYFQTIPNNVTVNLPFLPDWQSEAPFRRNHQDLKRCDLEINFLWKLKEVNYSEVKTWEQCYGKDLSTYLFYRMLL